MQATPVSVNGSRAKASAESFEAIKDYLVLSGFSLVFVIASFALSKFHRAARQEPV